VQLSGWRVAAAFVGAGVSLAACRHHSSARLPDAHTPGIEVLATAMIPPNAVFPQLRGTKFGGVSSIAYDAAHQELIGLSDDSENSRIFRMKYLEEPFRVVPVGVALLERGGGAPAKLDPEGLVLLPDGDILVSSEGFGNEEPRIPPAVVEYKRDGRFVRQLAVPSEFIPPEHGPLNHGVPNNQAFEALALTPDGQSLWTGVETALVQDGMAPTADHGSRTRLLQYRLEHGSFVPSREFVYEVDALPPMPSGPVGFSVSGLVDLLALSDRDFIALERAYVQNTENPNRDVYRARLYRVSIDGTAISPGQDSISGRPDLVAVTKTLLLDLGSSRNLPRALASLDNFEGIASVPTPPIRRSAVIPSLPKPRPTAILVSDDNFDDNQRTWFVKVGFDPALIP
jgi:hypothetical protein